MATVGILLAIDDDTRVEKRGADSPEDGAQTTWREEIVDVDDDLSTTEREGASMGGARVSCRGRPLRLWTCHGEVEVVVAVGEIGVRIEQLCCEESAPSIKNRVKRDDQISKKSAEERRRAREQARR